MSENKSQEKPSIVTFFLLFILMIPGLSLTLTALLDTKSPLSRLQEPDLRKSYQLAGEKIVKRTKKNARKNNKTTYSSHRLFAITFFRFVRNVSGIK